MFLVRLVFRITKCITDYSACGSDICGELQRLAIVPFEKKSSDSNPEPEHKPCLGSLIFTIRVQIEGLDEIVSEFVPPRINRHRRSSCEI